MLILSRSDNEHKSENAGYPCPAARRLIDAVSYNVGVRSTEHCPPKQFDEEMRQA
jgi:hypothetical protein